MTNIFTEYLSDLINDSILNISPVHGGDISDAFRIETETKSYFLKCQHGTEALEMFQVEAKGLRYIEATNTIKTPKVFGFDTFEQRAFLLLEYIEPKSPSPNDFTKLGKQLAALHQNTSKAFGIDHNNFIGRLNQMNNQHKNWSKFYVVERLEPQMALAKKKGLLLDSECLTRAEMLLVLNPYFEEISPSLLHGDLWQGNFIISRDGDPYLIDPAVYYGHSEVDMAMSKLFGGFSASFYKAYHAIIPADEHSEKRYDLYQLYYLLVHLNMFGSSYKGGVMRIISKYF